MPWFSGKSRAAVQSTLTRRTRRSSVALVLGALLVGTTLAACAGTPDNGTQPETMATFAARATEDATVPTPEPGAEGSPGAGPDLAAMGSQIATQNGCVGCHSIDGSASVGPTWQGLIGHEVQLADGGTVTADRDYIAESILDPSAKIVDGFQDLMPKSYSNFTDEQIDAIVAYIESLE